MKKEIKIELLFNPTTGNIIITVNNGNSQSSVTLPESLHPALHNLFMEQLKK